MRTRELRISVGEVAKQFEIANNAAARPSNGSVVA